MYLPQTQVCSAQKHTAAVQGTGLFPPDLGDCPLNTVIVGTEKTHLLKMSFSGKNSAGTLFSSLPSLLYIVGSGELGSDCWRQADLGHFLAPGPRRLACRDSRAQDAEAQSHGPACCAAVSPWISDLPPIKWAQGLLPT